MSLAEGLPSTSRADAVWSMPVGVAAVLDNPRHQPFVDPVMAEMPSPPPPAGLERLSRFPNTNGGRSGDRRGFTVLIPFCTRRYRETPRFRATFRNGLQIPGNPV